MVSKDLPVIILYLASRIMYCSGGCLETADIVYEEDSNYDYYDNQQQIHRINSISVECFNVNLENGQLQSDEPKNYQCAQCPQTLTVRNSIILTIHPSSFANYPSTTTLDMRSNGVENILPGAFNLLTSLEELDLSGNNITNIPDGVFNSLINLKMLDLSKNNIKNVGIHSFHGCDKLSHINLSLNSLQYFDSHSLGNKKQAIDLDLSFNKLEMFNFTSTLLKSTLILSNNRISNIYGCFGDVLVLDISKNLLSSLSNNTCSNPIITWLDVSYNSLSSLETTPALINLKRLDLQNNNIKFIPSDYFSKFGNLMFLNLSTNELGKLQYGLFDRLMYLKGLDLSKNHITSFKKYNYHLLRNLNKLYLHDNEINTFDSKDIKEMLSQLQELSLDGNNFTCDSLIEIFHDLRGVTILSGHYLNASNVHGIACSEIKNTLKVSVKQNVDSDEAFRTKLTKVLNIDFKKSSLYNYFYKDFKTSSFYKYLENLQLPEIIDLKDFEHKLNETDIQDFQNNTMNHYFSSGFRSSNFVKYFEKFKGIKDNSSGETAISNYFNKDFLSSSFYKKLETFKSPVFEIKYSNQENNQRIEKLINNFVKREQKGDNSILLLIIIVILVITSCIMLYMMYVIYIKFRKLLSATKITSN